MSPFVRCAWSSEKPQITRKEIERNIRCCCFTMAGAYHGYISPRSHLVGKPRCRRLASLRSWHKFTCLTGNGPATLEYARPTVCKSCRLSSRIAHVEGL